MQLPQRYTYKHSSMVTAEPTKDVSPLQKSPLNSATNGLSKNDALSPIESYVDADEHICTKDLTNGHVPKIISYEAMNT